MLVLSRQRDEAIMIGDEIEITVVDVRGDKVRLGITAPSSVAVHRKEVYEAIQREGGESRTVEGTLTTVDDDRISLRVGQERQDFSVNGKTRYTINGQPAQRTEVLMKGATVRVTTGDSRTAQSVDLVERAG